MINTHSFSCMKIALSTSFIIASEDTRECTREIRVWNKLDGEILTTLCINKCVEILNIRCGTNDILITEYHTYAPKPSMFTYQVKFFMLEKKSFLFSLQLTSQRILYNKEMVSGCTVSLDQESFVYIKGRDIVVCKVETGEELEIFPNFIQQFYFETILSQGLIRKGEAFLLRQNYNATSFVLIRNVKDGTKGTKKLVANTFEDPHFSNIT